MHLLPLMMQLVTCHVLTGKENIAFKFTPISPTVLARKHLNLKRESAQQQCEIRKREAKIHTIECKSSSPYCGFQGVVEYEHEARTTYQAAARARPTKDLQHFTKCLPPKKVERLVNCYHKYCISTQILLYSVVSIPLSANADYRGWLK
jgi:DNA (cytosine-5)-methyltransferase 1